jgi:hypothetical protein
MPLVRWITCKAILWHTALGLASRTGARSAGPGDGQTYPDFPVPDRLRQPILLRATARRVLMGEEPRSLRGERSFCRGTDTRSPAGDRC